MYLDTNNLYGWDMSQKLPVNGFERVENLSKFGKRFIKNYDKNRDKGYILEVVLNIQKIYSIFIKIFHF